jgi:predicted N-acetyltransferase YhbS
VIVRAAPFEDLRPVAGLLSYLHDPSTAKADESTWRKMLDAPGRIILVADRDDEIVGCADLSVVPNLTHDARPWALLENIVVDPSARRGGIGRALLGEAVERAKAAGCYKVQLVSNKRRAEAHAFYGSAGFESSAEGFRLYID